MVLTAGQVSDYRGADMAQPALPEADVLIAGEGYDSKRLRQALAKRNMASCIPRLRQAQRAHHLRHRVVQDAISSSACSADSKIGAASPYSAICLAATVIF